MKEATENLHDMTTSDKRYKRELRRKLVLKQYLLGGDSSVWYYFLLIVFTVASLWTRLHKLSEPTHIAWVCYLGYMWWALLRSKAFKSIPHTLCRWDETHFGKHASWYIQGSFFFDVHPPLGKVWWLHLPCFSIMSDYRWWLPLLVMYLATMEVLSSRNQEYRMKITLIMEWDWWVLH